MIVRQRHEPDAVGERVRGGRRDLEGEARLARPAGSGERDQPGLVEQRPTSASSRSRPMNAVSCVGRLLGRASSDRIAGKSVRQAVDDELGDLLRAQVLEPVRAERPRREPRRERAAPRRRAPPPRGAPGRRARRPRRVPPGARRGRRTVPSSSSSPRPTWMPIRTRISAPSGHGSAASPRWASAAIATAASGSLNATKNESPSVADLGPAVGRDGRADDRAVPGEHRQPRGRAQRLDEPRGSLDVREQERHGAGGPLEGHGTRVRGGPPGQ